MEAIRESVELEPDPKRRKIYRQPPRRNASSTVGIKGGVEPSDTVAQRPQTSGVNFRIQQDKKIAVAQAQEDGSTGNFRIFDSPFGNFLVPVVPTRAELAG